MSELDDFMPSQEQRSSTSRWVKPKAWKESTRGGRKVKAWVGRMLSKSVQGEVGFPDDGTNKPQRIRKGERWPVGTKWKPSNFDKEKLDLPRRFAANAWLDRSTGSVVVWEITQASIMDGIVARMEKWGPPTGYDLEFTQYTDAGRVKYDVDVVPDSKRPLTDEELAEWKMLQEEGFDLNRMFDGGDPFPKAAPAARADEGGAGSHAPDDLPF